MDEHKSILPWYINKTLTENEKNSVEFWIQQNPKGQQEYQTAHRISQITKTQEEYEPSKEVKTRIFSQIQQKKSTARQYSPNTLIWGGPILVLIFILLWLIIQPGTQLQWSTIGSTPASFRIYRAAAGSEQFELIEELPASSHHNSYYYSDFLLVPGQNYQYIIEVRDQWGNTSLSQVAMSDSMMILASQIALLLTSFMLTFGLITIMQESKISLVTIHNNPII
jgi:hypothetical protein